MTETATRPDFQFGLALDPMRPQDLVAPPGIAARPPACPVCDTLLHPMNQNDKGDQLFECLNGDGHYTAIYRVGTQTWEQRPGWERDGWVPPGTKQALVQQAAPKTKRTRTKKSSKRTRN